MIGTATGKSTDKLKVARHEHVVQVTIDHPPANTWDEQSLAALEALVYELEADREVFAIVLVGAGEKFFSAGADLNVFADGDKARGRAMARRFGAAFEALAGFGGVSIAAINGFAMGGGLECALACDIRVAERTTEMALPEAGVGLLPCGGGTQNLAWLVGEGWAKRMILCGERIDAETAERIGLVEEVVEAGEALPVALELAHKVGRQSPPAVRASKRLIQFARSGAIADGYAHEREAFVDLFDTVDQSEGVRAFLEKREPKWKNE